MPDDVTPNPAAPAGGDDTQNYPPTVLALMKDPDGIAKLLAKNTDNNKESESWRKKYEQAEKDRQAEKEATETAKLSELEKLTKQLEKLSGDHQAAQGTLKEKDKAIFALKAKFFGATEGAKDPDYIYFQAKQHMKSLPEDQRQAFNDDALKAWIADAKTKNTDWFGNAAPPPKPPAGGTPPPAPAGGKTPETGNEPPKVFSNANTHKEYSELNAHIRAVANS